MINGFVPGTTVHDGDHCPSCGQMVKLYPRTLSNATARVMCMLYQENEGRDYLRLPELLDRMTGTPHQGGYGTLGHHWKLMKQMPGERPDGSNRVGWWKLTDRGRSFVLGQVTVPKRALIYDGKCFGFDGPQWSVHQALGKKFNYHELMQGVVIPTKRKRIILRQP